jgi:hypothetical protein
MAEKRHMAEKAKPATNGCGKPGHNRENIRLYRKIIEHDHDADMDKSCCVIAKEGLTVGQAAMLSGVGNQTITNSQKKKTKRPQHLTINATLAGMGYSFTIKQVDKIDYETEMAKAETLAREARVRPFDDARLAILLRAGCLFGEGTKTPSRGPTPSGARQRERSSYRHSRWNK